MNSIIYAETYGNNNNNSSNLKIINDTSLVVSSYKFEPFLLVNGTDYKDISHKDSLSLDNFTISAWIKTNETNLKDPAHIVNKGGFNKEDKGKNMNYGIWLSRNGNIQGGFETKSGINYEVTSPGRYNDGKWHFILLSYDGSLLQLDVDAKKQVSSENTKGAAPDSTGEQPLRIGANSIDKDKFYSGNVDEVRVWNRGLTDSEISQIYSTGIFNTTGQVVYQDFKNIFNIVVAADWGCDENATKISENIQEKNPELVIAAGDLSYDESSDCWFEIIKPFMSRIKVAMGDHEYSDTIGGSVGIINEYLKPLNMSKTYYSFDVNNIHFTVIDPNIDYSPNSTQYQFIEQDLKKASSPNNNTKIDWLFIVEHIPMYTSPSKHLANFTIRDIYHPLFDKYGVDLVFSGDNHNYQRTFPLKYNNTNGNSSNPIISDRNLNNYTSSSNNDDYSGQIYIITGTGGRSLYDIQQQSPFVAKQYDEHYGFLNLDFTTNNTLTVTFYANEKNKDLKDNNNLKNNDIIDQFIISKPNLLTIR
jgi:predicted phosphodiesterase